jgi:DNA-directed RNA polymerase alpha subunit
MRTGWTRTCAQPFSKLAPKCRLALPRAGITTVELVEAMSDDELLAIDGVGEKTVAELRAALEHLAIERPRRLANGFGYSL